MVHLQFWKESAKKEEAEALKKAIEDAGGKVELKIIERNRIIPKQKNRPMGDFLLW